MKDTPKITFLRESAFSSGLEALFILHKVRLHGCDFPALITKILIFGASYKASSGLLLYGRQALPLLAIRIKWDVHELSCLSLLHYHRIACELLPRQSIQRRF